MFIAPVAAAKMYKWVDADGNTHYTQQPPPGDIQGEIIKPPPKVDTENAVKLLQEQKEKADELKGSRSEKAEKKRETDAEK